MNIIGYIRVSTNEQAKEGISIDVQRHMLKVFCELHGHELVSIAIDEGVSGSVPFNKREGGQQVVNALRSGTANGVICQRFDRMFRKLLDGAENFQWYEKNSFGCFSINEPVDASTPEGRMMLGMILITAQYERDKIEQRAREVSQSLKAQNKAWGHVPYGLMQIKGQLFKEPVLWEKRQHIVWLSTNQGLSIRNVIKELHKKHVKNPSGGRNWYTGTVSNIVKTHHELEHIPFYTKSNETRVSV